MPPAPFEIVCKEDHNHNVIRLVLEAPEPLRLCASCHVMVYSDQGDCRPYSPVRFDDRVLEFAVKVYPGGKVSPYLARCRKGDRVRVEMLPVRKEYRINEHRNVLMLCGGTGVTPAFQVLDCALSSPESETRFTLLFFNSTQEDVFLHDELEALVKRREPALLAIKYVCTAGDARNSADAIAEVVRSEVACAVEASRFDFVYTCGPPGFMDTVCGRKTPDIQQGELTGILKELGFSSDTVHKF